MVDAPTLAGRYRLERRIAAGGMGTVHEAMDDRLKRRVAVKILRDELAFDPLFVERFRREARAVAGLSHPNIASVFDYGEDGGRPFIVMELVPGRDLARVLADEGRFEPERAGRIALDICAALAHAHDAGIVHRDIKPANVILGPDDRVKVTDFGIARAAGDATLTGTGSVLGTANYIAPEHASGKGSGPHSDVYAAGVVLFEMVTGSVPFGGDSPLAVAMRHVSEDVPRPSRLVEGIPPGLDDAVARATARNPNERFHSADEMAAAITAALSGGGAEPTTPLAAGGGAAATKILTHASAAPYDSARLARIALVGLGVLALVAALLAVVRLGGGSDEGSARQPQGRDRPRSEQPAEADPGPRSIREDIIGMPADPVEEALEEAGFEVEIVTAESEAPEDTVIATEPPVGEVVTPGDTITLVVSGGGGSQGPGNGGGKAKGKDKHEEGDD